MPPTHPGPEGRRLRVDEDTGLRATASLLRPAWACGSVRTPAPRVEGGGRRAEGGLRLGTRSCSLPAASPAGSRLRPPRRLHSRVVPQVAVGPSSVGGLVQNTFLDGVKGHTGARGQTRVRGKGARDSGMLGAQTRPDAGSCSAVALPDLALWVQKKFF